MHTVRDIIEYIVKETVEYLDKSDKLVEKDSFLGDKLKRKFLEDKLLKPYKEKTIIITPKVKRDKLDMKKSLTTHEMTVIQIICEVHKIGFNDLFSRKQNTEHVDARKQLASFLYVYLNYSYSHIGMLLGRDHSTMIHNISSHESLLETDKVYCDKFFKVIDAIKVELPELMNPSLSMNNMIKEYRKLKSERTMNLLSSFRLKNKKSKS
jgi:hypothetical protein